MKKYVLTVGFCLGLIWPYVEIAIVTDQLWRWWIKETPVEITDNKRHEWRIYEDVTCATESSCVGLTYNVNGGPYAEVASCQTMPAGASSTTDIVCFSSGGTSAAGSTPKRSLK